MIEGICRMKNTLGKLLMPAGSLAGLAGLPIILEPDQPLVGKIKRAYLSDGPHMTLHQPSTRLPGSAPCMMWEPEGGDYDEV